MPDLVNSLFYIFSPEVLLVMAVGVFGGLIIGAIPGMTSTMAVGLLVPITFGMDFRLGITLLVAVYVGGISGGLISAILLNIPGTPSSVATTFDGTPMARRGEVGRALGLGIFSSWIGGTLSALALIIIAPQLASVAIKFSPYEYFAMVVFTLACIGAISKKSVLKGVIGACIGLILAMVGTSPTYSVARFTFGFRNLEVGFSELPVLIGMFAVAEILAGVQDIKKPVEVLNTTFRIRDFFKVIGEVFRHYVNAIRSSVIGLIIGILPGVGPGLSNIVAYTQARSASKEPETFGTGNPDGIIASESANNAATGGALIPLLTLGIPGDATTAMLLGAFMIHGLQPGPLLFRDSGPLVTIIMIGFLVANLLMLLIQTFCIRLFIKTLFVPKHLLYPVIITLCVVGCYALNSNIFDVWVFLFFGALGYVMNKLGFSPLPVILGLILGRMAEQQLDVGLAVSRGSFLPFLTRPVSGLLMLGAVLFLILPPLLEWRKSKKTQVA